MNKWIGMGRLTKAPELRYTATNNTAVCQFTVAINRRFKKDETDFINCQAWGKDAENISKFFDKGDMINVCGAIRVESWDNDEGKKIYATKINVEEWNFCGGKKESTESNVNDMEEVQQEGESDLPF